MENAKDSVLASFLEIGAQDKNLFEIKPPLLCVRR